MQKDKNQKVTKATEQGIKVKVRNNRRKADKCQDGMTGGHGGRWEIQAAEVKREIVLETEMETVKENKGARRPDSLGKVKLRKTSWRVICICVCALWRPLLSRPAFTLWRLGLYHGAPVQLLMPAGLCLHRLYCMRTQQEAWSFI